MTEGTRARMERWIDENWIVLKGALFLAAVVLIVIVSWNSSSSSSHATADCSGHNGNAAVAACHPDEQSVQDACPDNSGGGDYAQPTDECLQSVRDLPLS